MNLFQLSMHLLLEADTYRHRKKNLSSKAILMMNLTALLTIAFVVQLSAKDYGQLAILQEKHANFEKTNLFSSPTSVSANELLAYEIIGKTIVIKQKTEIVKPRVAETPIAAELPPPSFPVKGKITDENGNPLVKASVIIKSTNIGTTTNENGEFNLDVKDESAILVISYVGYENKEVSVKGKRTVNIILKQIVAEQQEVVVVGYGSQKKINLTGAIGSVSGESLEDRPIPNIGRGLQGELSGLNITSSDGQPGRSTTFNIRGYTSINGGSPLILVDGVPTDINNINPNDVASATVLKDAASAAVYGSRAPFGVLLITTKSGGKGIPKVGYSMNISSHKNSNLPDVVTDPATVMDFKNQAYAAYYGVNLYTSQQVDYAKQRSANPSLPITIVNPNNATLYDYYGSTNWFDELYRSSNISQIHNVNVSGGNDRVTYYFSGGYNEQTGIYRYNPDYYDRYNLRAKLSFQVTKWLEIHTNSVYNRTKYNYPSLWTSD